MWSCDVAAVWGGHEKAQEENGTSSFRKVGADAGTGAVTAPAERDAGFGDDAGRGCVVVSSSAAVLSTDLMRPRGLGAVPDGPNARGW